MNHLWHRRILTAVLSGVLLWSQVSSSARAQHITSRSLSTAEARDGQTVSIGYEIDSPVETAAVLDCVLTAPGGESVRDPDADAATTLSAGAAWRYRDFFINLPPSAETSGTYDVTWEVRWGSGERDATTETAALTILPPIPVRVPILMYHHVLPQAVDSITIAADEFRAQMKALRAYGYTSITFDDLLAFRAGLAAPPPKPVMITGDDGYEGWLTYAYPILADPQISFRMTGFLETGAIRPGAAQGVVWRRRIVPAYEAIERYLSWDQAAFLESTGVFDMHSHTVSHPHLPQLSEEDAREELARSKADVEERLGGKTRFLCYPYGEYGLRDQWLAREAGYFAAVTDRGGVETDCLDKWDWDRIGIYAGATVRYDPDRPWNFFPSLIEDPDIKIPKIRVESLEFLNPATGLPFAAGKIPRTASATIRLTAANTGPAADVIAGLRLDLETNPSSSLLYDTHLTEPSQDIARNFPETRQTFVWTWRAPADAPLGPYRAEATFHDVHYVLVFRTFSRQSAFSVAPKDPPSAWILR